MWVVSSAVCETGVNLWKRIPCACVSVCNLRKLLVCLLCNFCIFKNCSLGIKICKMCYCVSTVMYCDVTF